MKTPDASTAVELAHQPGGAWDTQAHAPALTRPRLPALTSLRFFAAFLIVVHHANGTFFPYSEAVHNANLQQGVTFFFVLSGFILTYVYPELKPGKWLRFLWARVARIWPAHLFALLLLIFLIGFSNLQGHRSPGIFVANIFLLQTWWPSYRSCFSFNAVSWTLSVELLFYVSFPLLIWKFSRTWHWKLAISIVVALALAWFAAVERYPFFKGQGTNATFQLALTALNPASRLFQFVLGMITAMAWRSVGHRVTLGRLSATLVELALVALCCYCVYLAHVPARWALGDQPASFGQLLWLMACGFDFLPFAALIFLLATERGWLSWLLSFAPLVLLGEISYSLYLLHMVIMQWYVYRIQAFALFPLWLKSPWYLLTIVVVSLVVFRFIETPARYFMTRLYPIKPLKPRPTGGSGPTLQTRWEALAPKIPARALELGALAIILGPVIYLARLPEVAWIGPPAADAMQARCLPAPRNVPLSPRLTLMGLRVHRVPGGAMLTLVWHNPRWTTLKQDVLLELSTPAGTVLHRLRFPQESSHMAAPKNSYWFNRTFVQARLMAGCSAVSVAIAPPRSNRPASATPLFPLPASHRAAASAVRHRRPPLPRAAR